MHNHFFLILDKAVQSLQLYCVICHEVTFLCATQSSLRLDDISVLKLVNTCENFSVEPPYMYPGCEVTYKSKTYVVPPSVANENVWLPQPKHFL